MTPGRLNGHSRNPIILECKSPKHLATVTYTLYHTLHLYFTLRYIHHVLLSNLYMHLITWVEIQLIFTTPIRFYNRPHLFQGFEPIKWQMGGQLCTYVLRHNNILRNHTSHGPSSFPCCSINESTLSSCTQHLKSKSLGLTFGQGHLRRCGCCGSRSKNQAR